MKNSLRNVMWLQLAAALLTLVPLFFLNAAAFAGNSDGLFYTVVLKLVAHHMAQGDFWPGWLAQANGGAGSPFGYYYSLLAYQITALLGAPIAVFDPLGWKRLLLGMTMAQWAGGVAAWAWLSRRASPNTALIVSLLFTLFPYKWIYIYLHTNLAQLWALVWLPPLMMAAEDMAEGKRPAIGWYGLWLALLALTHPRTLLAFAAVPALYAWLFAAKGRCRTLPALIGAHLWAGALAAFYLLPGMLNLPSIQNALADAGRMDYAGNLSHKDIALNYHYVIIAVLLIGLRLRLPELKHTRAEKEMLFWLGILFAVAFLCLRISKPVWDTVTPLQWLQFPAARLHAAALVAACALSALFLDWRKRGGRLPFFYSPTGLLVPVIVMTYFVFAHVNAFYRQAAGLDWAYVEKMDASAIILPPEYLTRWQPGANSPAAVQANAASPLASLADGHGNAQAHFDKDELLIHAAIDSGSATLRLRQLYWPGWHIDGVPLAPDKDGMTSASLPHGEHDLVMRMLPLPGQRAGDLLSLAAWLGLAVFLCCKKKDKEAAVCA